MWITFRGVGEQARGLSHENGHLLKVIGGNANSVLAVTYAGDSIGSEPRVSARQRSTSGYSLPSRMLSPLLQ